MAERQPPAADLRSASTVTRVGLVVSAVVLAVAAGECLLRVFPNQLLPGPVLLQQTWRGYGRERLVIDDEHLAARYRPDAELTVRGHPDFTFTVRTRSLGFPGIGFRDDGIDGPPWAVVVGDSHAFGFGVDGDETFSELLEEATGRDVANLARVGDSSVELLHVLRRYGLPLGPKLVVWAFYVNDLEGTERSAERLRATAEKIARARRDEAAGRKPLGDLGSGDLSIAAWLRLANLAAGPRAVDSWTFDDNDTLPRAIPDHDGLDLAQNAELTVTAWLRWQPATGGNSPIAWKRASSPDGSKRGWSVWIDPNGRLQAEIDDWQGAGLIDPDAVDVSLADGDWHHVAVVFQRPDNLVQLYIDGRVYARAAVPRDGATENDRPLFLGGRPDGTRFAGALREVALYDRALAPRTLDALYRKHRGGHSGTVLSKLLKQRGFSISIESDGHPTVRLAGERVTQRVVADRSLASDRWNHVAVAIDRDRGTIRWFVDGLPSGVAELDRDLGDIANAGPLVLNRPVPFAGTIDHLTVFDTALDPLAVARLHGDLPVADHGVVADWSFDHDEAEQRALDLTTAHDAIVVQGERVPGRGDDGGALRFAGRDGFARAPPQLSPSVGQRVKHALWQRSHLIRLAAFAGGSRRYDSYRLPRQSVAFRGDGLDLVLADRSRWLDPRQLGSRELASGWQLTRRALHEAADTTRAAGAELVVVILPFKEQVYWHLIKDDFDPERLAHFEVDWMTSLVAELCRRRGIRVLDLTTALRSRARAGEQLYFRVDGHINANGHRAVADELHSYLRDNGLLHPPVTSRSTHDG